MTKIIGGLVAAMNVWATVVVDFDVVTGDVNDGAQTTRIDSTTGDRWSYSDATAVFTGDGSGQNTVIYGGVDTTWSVEQTYDSNFRLLRNSGLQVQVNPGTVCQTGVKGMLFWKKEDFLTGADGSVSFLSGDSLSMNIATLVGSSKDVRFVVNQGGDWYASGSSANGVGAFLITPTEESWYSIAADDTYALGSSGTTLVLDDVQAVGLYMDITRDSSQTNVIISDFQALASIPEPASLGLLGMSCGVIAVLRRLAK